MNDEERQLWRVGDLECVMMSCCSGAELQLRRGAATSCCASCTRLKTDLYERARDLQTEYARGQAIVTTETAETAEKTRSSLRALRSLRLSFRQTGRRR